MDNSTQDVYARAVCRLSTAYDCCPDRLTADDLRELSLQHIQKLLGNVSITTTLLYTKLTEPAQQQAGELIDTMIQDLPITLDAPE